RRHRLFLPFESPRRESFSRSQSPSGSLEGDGWREASRSGERAHNRRQQSLVHLVLFLLDELSLAGSLRNCATAANLSVSSRQHRAPMVSRGGVLAFLK